MREILFRGKRISNSKWVEGFMYSQHFPLEFRDDFYIRCYDTDYLVIPETVGQYTGVKTYSKHDDELHKIFEDDLCYVTEFDCDGNDEQHLCQVMFDCGTFYFKDVNSDWCRAFYEIGDIESDVELVGNIHDNPELIGNASQSDAADIAQEVLKPATPENFELMPG